MDFAALKAPFPEEYIQWRIAQSGMTKQGEPWAKVLAYVDARAVQDRLDEVCGQDGWANEQPVPMPNGDVLQGLSIKVPPPEGVTYEHWITKWDGADKTDIEATKGGISDAFKRAAVLWGIGRYLYDLGDSWAEFTEKGKYKSKIKQKDGSEKWFSWNPPALPEWAKAPKKPVVMDFTNHAQPSSKHHLSAANTPEYPDSVSGKVRPGPVEPSEWYGKAKALITAGCPLDKLAQIYQKIHAATLMSVEQVKEIDQMIFPAVVDRIGRTLSDPDTDTHEKIDECHSFIQRTVPLPQMLFSEALTSLSKAKRELFAKEIGGARYLDDIENIRVHIRQDEMAAKIAGGWAKTLLEKCDEQESILRMGGDSPYNPNLRKPKGRHEFAEEEVS